jgi:hypothetical protein
MNNNVKGIITVGIVIGLGFLAYKKFVKPDNRKVVLKYLEGVYGKNENRKANINSADKGYIDSWANAIKKNSETFKFNDKIYLTKGGTVKR